MGILSRVLGLSVLTALPPRLAVNPMITLPPGYVGTGLTLLLESTSLQGKPVSHAGVFVDEHHTLLLQQSR